MVYIGWIDYKVPFTSYYSGYHGKHAHCNTTRGYTPLVPSNNGEL